MNIPESIIVTIPAQEYNDNKYIGISQRCYLEEALDKAGFVGATVSGDGYTRFESDDYFLRWRPVEVFNANTVKEAFNAGQAITVKLVKTNVSW